MCPVSAPCHTKGQLAQTMRRLAATLVISCHMTPMLPAAERPAPPANGARQPAAVPEHVQQEVQRRLEYSISLAERGAVLSARIEAMDALRLVIRTLDATDPHARRSALLEAAFKQLFAEPATSDGGPQAMQAQFQESTQTLVRVSAGQPMASLALCTLGRLQTMPQTALEQDQRFASARAMALHLAAAQTDPHNRTAAHELGTLFALYGQLEQAEFWLRRSTWNSDHPESFENLATVLERSGKTNEAAEARRHAARFAEQGASELLESRPAVTWVDAAAFNQLGGQPAGPADIQLTAGSVTKKSQKQPAASPARTESKSTSRWRLFPRSSKN